MSDKESTTPASPLRLPRQERSAARIAKVIAAAERMLEAIGPEKTSIPALAEAAGVPRTAIYPFFPDKYALFAHMATIQMGCLAQALATISAEHAEDWREWVGMAIKAVADYYNANPVAGILLLRGAFTDDDRHAHAAKSVTIGELFRAKVAASRELRALPATPDVAAIAVELAFACMKHGYLQESKVSPAICQEAVRAVTSYLSHWDNNGI